MMTYDDFKTEVVEQLKLRLPEEYDDYTGQTIQKTNSNSYEGLTICSAQNKRAPHAVMNFTKAYDDYLNGTPIERIVDVFEGYVTAPSELPGAPETDIASTIADFEKVKDKILPRVINVHTNRDYIQNKVYKYIKGTDMVITYNVIVGSDENGVASVGITKELAKHWKVKQTDIIDVAMNNLKKEAFTLQTLPEYGMSMIFGIEAKNYKIEDLKDKTLIENGLILSNKNGTFGAMHILNKDLLTEISKIAGEIYILPSSVHEVILLPKEPAKLESLRELVKQTNEEQVELKDRLTNSVLEFKTNLKCAVAS